MTVLGTLLLVVGFVIIMIGKVWNLFAKYSDNHSGQDRAAIVTVAGAIIAGSGLVLYIFR